MKQYQVPRGTQDLFGEEVKKWQVLETKIRQFCQVNQLSEMRTPEFEHTEVFKRENDSSDVVNKEMYTFEDFGKRSLTLKPEGTAGLIRAYVNHKLYAQVEPYHKYFYITPAFRYERPQQGRQRIHHQFGVEILGEKSPIIDVSCILLGLDFISALGLNQYEVHINTLGDEESRANYRQALKQYFRPHLPQLCPDCHRRYEQNPLRILDCKVDKELECMKQAPKMVDYLNQASKDYFEEVLTLLKQFGVKVVINDNLVRGLDYYTHTVFEVISTHPSAGAQATIFGGGRYDNLVAQLGGPDISSVGFGMGIERLLLRLENEEIQLPTTDAIDVYGIGLSKQAQVQLLELVRKLRQNGISCELDLANRSLKAQFKSSERYKAKYLLILGDDEINASQIQIKNTKTQLQEVVQLSDVVNYLVNKLEK